MTSLEMAVTSYRYWSSAEAAWKAVEGEEMQLSVVTGGEEGEEVAVLTVLEGRDLLQHLQLAPWPALQPRVSVCVGSGSLLVQVAAEGGAKFLMEVAATEGEQVAAMLELLAGPTVPRVAVICLKEWREERLVRLVTPTLLATASEVLKEAGEEEVREVREDLELMGSVRRAVRRVGREAGLLSLPDTASQDLLASQASDDLLDSQE